MSAQVLVLGAGIVGTCTALHLAMRGHRVVLVDRREPGRETSYGNAGIIQREAVEPYAFPQDWSVLANVALKRGAAVHYHLRALPAIAHGLRMYWSHSRPRTHAAISALYARLIEHSTSEHAPLIARAGAEDLVRRDGYHAVFRSDASFERAAARAHSLASTFGIRLQLLDGATLRRAEPGLRADAGLAGAVHWLDPWTVSDPGELVARYAALLAREGGEFARGDANTLRPCGSGWSVRTGSGTVEAEHAVLALGPWSDALVRTLGYRFPLFVKRGYHSHYRGSGPRLPMLDADAGLVLAPMAQGVRLTTGAEFALLDAPATPVQVDRAKQLANELFELGDAADRPWMGARPCTGDMLPLIGPAPRHRGLWFNFGHAHQGFTMGPVSGRLLAEMLDGTPTVVDPKPYAPARFG
ncbi:FAD-dependent oxidoreductase [Ramlibacter sp. AN1015]|uniref:NAD(P)/FAD-dependent oxidoreductase n=1 Tax=Ramlibacter sp. AN1015 TaxID=3133428 RepID=UPI0030BC075E